MRAEERAIFDRVPGLIVVVDAEGRVVFWNRAAAVLTGLPSEAAAGRTLRELVGAGAPLTGRTTPLCYEDWWFLPRGEQRRFSWSHASAGEDDGVELFIENGVELPKGEPAASPRLREELVAALAHDLRSPLHAIKLTASLLRGRLPANEPSVARESVEAILSSTERAKRIVEDFSDVTRLEGGRLELDLKRVSASLLFQQAAEAERPAAMEASLELTVDVPATLPDIRVDRARVVQAVHKLIENALKLTRKGGRVHVAARVEGAMVLFSVEDTGPGIAPHRIEALLGNVWAHREERHKLHVGLPFARGLIEALGGRLWIESELGQGTRAMFTVPIAPSEA